MMNGTELTTALTLDQAHQFRVHVEALAAFANEHDVAIQMNIHGVDRISAWDAFPDASEGLLRIPDAHRVTGVRRVEMGRVKLALFTGDVEDRVAS